MGTKSECHVHLRAWPSKPDILSRNTWFFAVSRDNPMHSTRTKMIKMERLGPINVHKNQKSAENYWQPKIKEAPKTHFLKVYRLIVLDISILF